MEGFKMRTVLILIIAILMVGLAPMCEAKAVQKSIPLFKGKPGTMIGDVRINPKDGAEMVWVPAGEFTMGSTEEQTAVVLKEWPKESQELAKLLFDAEKPQHKVSLDGYWMYKYEVTVAQYRKFCEATKKEMPVAPDRGWKENHPMVNVSWQDAADYAEWAGVTLPTEAQWEKAARGTDGRIYPWGNDWDASKCANSVKTRQKSTQVVGSYPTGASKYGCMDMAGNVWEWCADWYDPNYYKKAPTKNPTGPLEGVPFEIAGTTYAGHRMLRGGSWLDDYNVAFRCAGRYSLRSSYRYSDSGFRCARTP
jgi:formylglycine-generating enzyme required for sulfatase activity